MDEVESTILDDESQRKKHSPEKLFFEILKSLEEYTTEKVEVLLSNKSKFFSSLKTHRPLKIVDYHYCLTKNLVKNRCLIVFEFNDKRMVRQYYKQPGEHLWRCVGCKRQYQNQLRSSCFYLHLINGVILVPVDHDCPPRDTDIVLQYQKFLEEGNGPLARRMTSLVNFDFGETSLANIVNKLNLPSSSLQRSSTLTGKGNENINVEKTLANLKRKLNVTDYTSSSADKPCTAKKSKEIEVGDKIDILSNHKNTVKMMEKETTPIRITTFLFEKPSVSALKNICNKLDIKYCKEAMNFWKEIKFFHLDTVSINIQTQKFKTKNFYKILSNFFTGKFCDYDQIYYAINMAFGEKLLADDQLSYEEIDLLCSSFTVTEKHFKFIAKFIPCRILIFDSDSDKKEPRKFGKWKNDCRNILTLVLSFSNRKYSVVVNL